MAFVKLFAPPEFTACPVYRTVEGVRWTANKVSTEVQYCTILLNHWFFNILAVQLVLYFLSLSPNPFIQQCPTGVVLRRVSSERVVRSCRYMGIVL